MLFSNMYKIIANKDGFGRFREVITPIAPLGIPSWPQLWLETKVRVLSLSIASGIRHFIRELLLTRVIHHFHSSLRFKGIYFIFELYSCTVEV